MNNYNCSTSGFNIEASIFLDEIISQDNFDMNIEKCENFHDYYIYTNFGNLGYELKFNIKLIDISDLFYIDYDITPKRYFYKMFLDHDIDYFQYDISDYVSEVFDNMSLSEIEETLEEFNIKHTKKFDIVQVTGYRQGDFAEVIILTDALKKIWDIDKIDLDALETEISHYFYDAPMCCRLTINNEEYYIDEYDGQYQEFKGLTYDKEVVINEVLKQYSGDNMDVLRDELDTVVPESIEY